MIEEGEEGDPSVPFRSWDKRRRERLCLISDTLLELGARTYGLGFSFGLHLCFSLPGFGTLVIGVTRRKESAALVWGFVGFAPTGAAASGVKAECDGRGPGTLPRSACGLWPP